MAVLFSLTGVVGEADEVYEHNSIVCMANWCPLACCLWDVRDLWVVVLVLFSGSLVFSERGRGLVGVLFS